MTQMFIMTIDQGLVNAAVVASITRCREPSHADDCNQLWDAAEGLLGHATGDELHSFERINRRLLPNTTSVRVIELALDDDGAASWREVTVAGWEIIDDDGLVAVPLLADAARYPGRWRFIEHADGSLSEWNDDGEWISHDSRDAAEVDVAPWLYDPVPDIPDAV